MYMMFKYIVNMYSVYNTNNIVSADVLQSFQRKHSVYALENTLVCICLKYC